MTLKINYPNNPIITRNLYIKKLSINLVNENYLKWINVKQSFIVNSDEYYPIESLRKFVLSKLNKNNILFFAIFNKQNRHIGNIKFEPISIGDKAVMGILIGDVSHQNKKLSNEIMDATFRFLKINYCIKRIILGVNLKNFYAIKSFKRFGFKFIKFSRNRTEMIMDYKL
jgi:RimJ/RimL family protein N-acetyltransferase